MFYLKSVGKSLTFRGAVYEAQDILRHHRCKDPICDTHLWKVKHELDMAKIRIRQLEKDLEAHGIKPTQTKYALPFSLIPFNSVSSYESTRLHRVFAMRSSEKPDWSSWIAQFTKTEAYPLSSRAIRLSSNLIGQYPIRHRSLASNSSITVFGWFYFSQLKQEEFAICDNKSSWYFRSLYDRWKIFWLINLLMPEFSESKCHICAWWENKNLILRTIDTDNF